ncbi:MAG: nucleoside triphosphate pyrophosphohydrolase [Oscillatoriales cyanobacterium SM2_2_1]|nr:nucleoside triphosphate pyrophosphohydrolase [Oscillatoriales cyanobacterium SM2_2_1]
MSRKYHNKLVRDRIPEIICQTGRTCEAISFNDSDYMGALLEKLLEECREAVCANEEDLLGELVDLVEVIDAILKFKNIDDNRFKELKEKKRLERGGFERRFNLIWSE